MRFVLLLGLLFSFPALAQTTAAGSTPGSFRVTESGAAEYRIALRVPPGIAGLEPKLALTYNSQAGNGLLGMGWNLEGLSAITRCPRTMAQDGVRGGVSYDANDRFCLDGQRLVAIPPGAYGADGTEYRTERESFTKVVSYGTAGSGPAWFKVWTKSGQILEYGKTGDARFEVQNGATVMFWAVNRIQDAKENYLSFVYTKDNDNREHFPARIDYTGNSAAGTTPSRSIQFVYAIRGDPSYAYAAGSVTMTRHRLTNVRTFSGSTALKDYRLTYENGSATTRSRLAGVLECAGDGTSCLAPTTTTWSNASLAWSIANIYGTYAGGVGSGNAGYGVYPASQFLAGDFNGDGRTDILQTHNGWSSIPVCVSTGSAWECSNHYATFVGGDYGPGANGSGIQVAQQFLLGDVNGDGRTDVIQVNNELWGTIPVCFSSGAGWQCRNDFANYVGGVGTGIHGSGNYSGARYLAGDFDGDGRTDIIQANPNWMSLPVCLSTGTGWACSNHYATNVAGSDGNYGSGVYPAEQFLAGDFNGDGRTDVIQVNQTWFGSIPVCLSTGTGWECINHWATYVGGIGSGIAGSGNYPGATYLTGDFNGDGKTDVMQVNESWSSIPVCVSTGAGWACSNHSAQLPIASGRFYAADVNGDGRTDIVKFSHDINNVTVCLSTGFGWSCTGLAGGLYGGAGSSVQVGDFAGDGVVELFETNVNGGSIPVLSFFGGPVADLAQSVTPPSGAPLAISYKPLTDASVYTKDTDASYPVVDTQPSLHVVSSYTSSNGSGGSVQQNHAYGGLKIELGTGRGSLGFRWRDSYQTIAGVQLRVRAESRQDWPYVGLTSLVRKSHGADALLSQVSNSFGCINPGSGGACTAAPGNRYFPFVSQGIEIGADLDGAALPTLTTSTSYDSFGNPTSIAVSTGDGHSKTTTNTFSNDTANWRLGRLMRSTVESTRP